MDGRRREEKVEGEGFYMEDLYPIASEYEEIPSFRYLSDSFRWFSWNSRRSTSSSTSGSSSSISDNDGVPADHVKIFSLQELQKATQNFHGRNLLARGGFSHFYRGRIAKGNFSSLWSRSGMVVGIKKFLPTSECQQAYDTELHYLRQLDHPNIVKLVGYCTENDTRLLVYEFMPNGNLAYQLSKKHGNILSWTLRIKIATQIAGVLSFLHGSECQIVHQLVNPAGILLDSKFNAKLAAFGLAKPIPNSEESKGPSTKHDVHHFGIVLLALLSGHAHRFPPLTWDNLGNKSLIHEFVDRRLDGKYTDEEAYAVACLAARCVNAEPHLRPDIHEVLAILQSVQAPEKLHD